MKKFITILMVVILTFTLVACGKQEEEEVVESDKENIRVCFVCEQLGDNSFTDSCANGLKQAQADFGIELDIRQLGSGTDLIPSIREAAENGYDIVVFGHDTDRVAFLDDEAANFPDTIFFVYDGGDTSYIPPENVLYVIFKANESDFVCGAIAAMQSKTKVTGWIGGQEYTSLYDFLVGWVTGVKYADETASTAYSWVAGDSPWSDPAKAKDLTNALISNYNIDIAHGVAGQSGDGVIQAIAELRESGVEDCWMIGVDSDQYAVYTENGKDDLAEVILTSSLKKVAQPVYDLVKTIKNGETPKLGNLTYGIAEGAAGAADNEFYRANATEEALAVADKITEDVLNGSLVVKSAYGMSIDELTELFTETTLNYATPNI